MRKLRILVATSFGIGLIPFFPATFGSAAGVLLFLLGPGSFPARLSVAAFLAMLGFWSAPGAIEHFGRPDPKPVVIDEVSAQYLALFIQGASTPLGLGLGFVVFRVMDVLKPFGIRRLEALPGGFGVMADDLAAAVLGGIALRAATRLFGLPL